MAGAIVLDANVPVRAVLDRDEHTLDVFRTWATSDVRLVAPDLWLPEAITAVRRAVATGAQPAVSQEDLLDDLFALPVDLVDTDLALGAAALKWAARIGQSKVYDALYLAVAERLDAPLVTLDERLLARCRQLGLEFVEGLPAVDG